MSTLAEVWRAMQPCCPSAPYAHDPDCDRACVERAFRRRGVTATLSYCRLWILARRVAGQVLLKLQGQERTPPYVDEQGRVFQAGELGFKADSLAPCPVEWVEREVWEAGTSYAPPASHVLIHTLQLYRIRCTLNPTCCTLQVEHPDVDLLVHSRGRKLP